MSNVKSASVYEADEAVASGPAESKDGSVTQYTAKQEARVVRKLDWNLMTIFFVLYMLAFLDRGNIGNAKLAGLPTDLGLNNGNGYNSYQWLVNIFYITYIVFEFGVLLWKVFPPHIVGTFVVFGWGLMATVQAAVQNWGSLMALRFLLGALEACYGPGIIFLLSFFYLRHEIGFRCGIFASAAPLASTFAGALAYGITSGHSHLANWRLLFLVEGLPTVAMAVVAFFFIPDSPEKARFLTDDEKDIVRSRVIRQVGTNADDRIGGFKLKDAIPFVKDLKAWICAVMYFCGNVTYGSLPLFLPTILEDMGYTAIDAQGLSAPPSFLAFLCALVTTWIADKTQQRCYVIAFTSIVGAIGYVVLATVETVGVRYFATFLASAGVFSTIPNILGLTLNNQGSDARRGMSIVLINLIGQCGPFVGNNVFTSNTAPRYTKGMAVCAAFMFFSAILALSQRYLLSWENSKLDSQYGAATQSNSDDLRMDNRATGVEAKGAATENYGPNFRYVL
ncbi:MFS general substrate transporter [Hypoxylon sp. FL1150]|nr:MFS general substrate transporter [Hypoxylon sp. FL1150]